MQNNPNSKHTEICQIQYIFVIFQLMQTAIDTYNHIFGIQGFIFYSQNNVPRKLGYKIIQNNFFTITKQGDQILVPNVEISTIQKNVYMIRKLFCFTKSCY